MGRLQLVIASTVVLIGCGHVTKLRPAEKGAVQLEASVGGPLANVGTLVLVAPMTTVGASTGLTDRLDVSANVHPTALLFSVVGIDVGSSVRVLEGEGPKPTLTATGRLYGFGGLRGGFRPYLELSAAATWALTDRWSLYASASGLGQLTLPPLWAAGVGAEVKLGRGALQLEARWFNAHADSSEASVEWLSPYGRGALGVVAGGRFEVMSK